MDVRFVNPFVKSICNTFESMCSLKVVIGRPEIKIGAVPGIDVSGLIGFSGDAAGCVVLHFDFGVAGKVASRVAGTDLTAEHEDFPDTIGRLANRVVSGAYAQFKGLDISVSLPNVIIGRNHVVSASRSTPRTVIPCRTDVGSFQAELAMVLANEPGLTDNKLATLEALT